MKKKYWLTVAHMLGLALSPRVFNEINPYIAFLLAGWCIYYLIKFSIKQINQNEEN